MIDVDWNTWRPLPRHPNYGKTPLEDYWTLENAVAWRRHRHLGCGCCGGPWCCLKLGELTRRILRQYSIIQVKLAMLRDSRGQ